MTSLDFVETDPRTGALHVVHVEQHEAPFERPATPYEQLDVQLEAHPGRTHLKLGPVVASLTPFQSVQLARMLLLGAEGVMRQ